MSRREATVQGEVHAGEADKRALLAEGLEGYDAVVVEGRSPTLVVRELTFGYAAFLAGYVTLMWVQAAVSRLRSRVGGGVDLRAAAEGAGVDYHDGVDADTAVMYGMTSPATKYLLGAAFAAAFAFLYAAGVHRLVLVVVAVSMPYLYTTAVVLAVKFGSRGRAAHMADRITTLAEDRSYDRVAVLCGDAHREDVGEALERREWTVTTRRTRHPLGRLFGPP